VIAPRPRGMTWPSSGAVFDTGALIALDRRSREVAAIVDEARRGNARISIPAGCVGQAWRDPARQARLASLLRLANVDVVSLDDAEARRVGLLLAARRGRDVVDAHLAIVASRLRQTVVTSDPDDIARLAPSVRTHLV